MTEATGFPEPAPEPAPAPPPEPAAPEQPAADPAPEPPADVPAEEEQEPGWLRDLAGHSAVVYKAGQELYKLVRG